MQHPIYTQWEQQKLAAAGLRSLSTVGIVAPLLLLASLVVLFGESLARLLPACIALVGAAVGAVVVYVRTLNRGVDVERPYALASAILVAQVVAGAMASVALGGAASPWPWGLSLLTLAWPALMPGGLRRAWPVLSGAALLHLALLTVAGTAGLGPVVVLTLLLAGAAATLAQVMEHWRLRAASSSGADWLTGALSRPELLRRLAALLNLRQRSLEPFTVVMIDVDRFKTMNAEHGRGAGDEALELLAATVAAEVRPSDLFGRLGQDEFLIVLDQCEAEGALKLVQRVQQRLARTELIAQGQRLRVSFSAGIVPVAPGDGLELKELLGSAERALAESLEAARNRTSFSATRPLEPSTPTDPHLLAAH